MMTRGSPTLGTTKIGIPQARCMVKILENPNLTWDESTHGYPHDELEISVQNQRYLIGFFFYVPILCNLQCY